jgi:hypothetical protein
MGKKPIIYRAEPLLQRLVLDYGGDIMHEQMMAFSL